MDIELATFSVRPVDPQRAKLQRVVRHTRATTVASTDPLVLPWMESQYALGYGSCLPAIHELTSVHVPNLLKERRWPGYATAAYGQGIRSIPSVPLLLFVMEAELDLKLRRAIPTPASWPTISAPGQRKY